MFCKYQYSSPPRYWYRYLISVLVSIPDTGIDTYTGISMLSFTQYNTWYRYQYGYQCQCIPNKCIILLFLLEYVFSLLSWVNEAQIKSIKTELLPSDTPGAPYKLEPSDIAKDSLTLSWYEPDEDGGSPITGYWVERYEPEHDKWIRCNKLPIKDTNYRFLLHFLPEITTLSSALVLFFF